MALAIASWYRMTRYPRRRNPSVSMVGVDRGSQRAAHARSSTVWPENARKRQKKGEKRNDGSRMVRSKPAPRVPRVGAGEWNRDECPAGASAGDRSEQAEWRDQR